MFSEGWECLIKIAREILRKCHLNCFVLPMMRGNAAS